MHVLALGDFLVIEMVSQNYSVLDFLHSQAFARLHIMLTLTTILEKIMSPEITEDDLSFGEWLREARAEKKFSMRALASQLDITPAYLSDIENDNRVPAEEIIQKMAAILEFDFDEAMIRAGRFGKDTERYMRRQRDAVRLLRRVSEANLSAAELKELSAAVEKASEEKKNQAKPK